MRWLVAACVGSLFGCGSVAEDAEPCPLDENLMDKRWLVGELADAEDDPRFTATVSIVNVELEGPDQPVFFGATAVFDVGFEISEDMLIARTSDDGDDEKVDPLAVFVVMSHRESSCHVPYREELSVDWGAPQTLPWFERPWFRVDWGRNLGQGYRFDAASAAGYSEAAQYEPVGSPHDLNLVPKPELALDDGYLVVFVRTYVEWKPIDDATRGCVFDLPSLDPGADCPVILVTLRYEFRRAPPRALRVRPRPSTTRPA